MTRSRVCGALLFAGVLGVLSSCGSGRRLETVSVSPAAADAKNFPSGQVQFTATGTFTRSPSPAPLTSNDIQWCVGTMANAANASAGTCVGNIVPFATIDQNGLAQCSASSQGTVVILAGKPPSTMMIPDQGQQLAIFGSAQLTCP